MKKFWFVSVSCVLFLAVGCNSSTDGRVEAKSQMSLGVYNVPSSAGSASAIEPSIRRLLSLRNNSDADDLGTVISTGSGQLLVVAPKEFQKGMAEFIQQLSQSSASNSVAQHNIRQEFWILVGTNGQVANNKNIPSEIEPVVNIIKQESGNNMLALLEKLSVTSLRGEWIASEGKNVRMEGRAEHQGERIFVTAQIQALDNKLDSEIMVKDGEFLVLGESNAKGLGKEEREALLGSSASDENVRLYVVIRASKK